MKKLLIALLFSTTAVFASQIVNPGGGSVTVNTATTNQGAYYSGASAISGAASFTVNSSSITLGDASHSVSVSSPMAMNSNKISGLAAATTSGDGVRFEQITTNQNGGGAGGSVLSAGAATSFTTVSNMSAAITSKSTTGLICIAFNTNGSVSAGTGHLALFRDSSDLAGGTNDQLTVNFTNTTPIAYTYIDLPGDTSAHTYALKYYMTSNANNMTLGQGGMVSSFNVWQCGY